MFSYILLECTFAQNLPMALALCLLPFLLGWLAAYAFYGVGSLKNQLATLTTQNGDLNAKVNTLTGELTDTRVKLTQAEAEIERLNELLRKAKGRQTALAALTTSAGSSPRMDRGGHPRPTPDRQLGHDLGQEPSIDTERER